MSEVESFHEVGDDEVQFREDDPTPPIPITTIDMEVIIKGWEEKFEHISRCLREVQLASEESQFRHVRHQQRRARARE